MGPSISQTDPAPGRAAFAVSDLGVARLAYLASVIVAGALVLLLSAGAIIWSFPGPAWLLLLGLTCVTAWTAVRMRSFPVTLSLSNAFTVAAALLLGPAVGAVTVACDAAIMCARLDRERRTVTRVLFNITAPALAMWLSAHLFFRIAGSGPLYTDPTTRPIVVPLLLFAAAYFLLNSLLVAGAISIGRGLPFIRVWRHHFLPLWATHVGGTALAAVVILLFTADRMQPSVLMVALPAGAALLIAINVAVDRYRRHSASLAELRS
jgi:hypothetical protein